MENLDKTLLAAALIAFIASGTANAAIIDPDLATPDAGLQKKTGGSTLLLKKIGTDGARKKAIDQQVKKTIDSDLLDKPIKKKEVPLVKTDPRKKVPAKNVPEPALGGLFLLGVAGLGVVRRKIGA